MQACPATNNAARAMPAAKCTQNGGFIPSAQQLQTTESLNFESVPFSVLWVAMTPECENGLWRNADLAPDIGFSFVCFLFDFFFAESGGEVARPR